MPITIRGDGTELQYVSFEGTITCSSMGKMKYGMGFAAKILVEKHMSKTPSEAMQTRGRKHFNALWFVTLVGVLLMALLLSACGTTGTTGAGTPTTNVSVTTTTGSTVTPVSTSTNTNTPTNAGNNTPTPPAGSVPAHQLQFTTIRMIDTSTGWALTSSGVYKTSDGGKYWSNVGPLSTQLKNPAGEFLNAQDAWVVATMPNSANPNTIQVIRTLDGGQSWQLWQSSILSTSYGDYPGVPDFVNLQDGWIEMVTNGGPGAGSESVAIFRTTDGGQVWTKVADTTQQGSGLPNGGLKTGISFKDSMNGWATGYDASSTPWLYVTYNAGQTWQRQSLPGASNAFNLTTPPVFFGNLGILPVAETLQSGNGVVLETALYTTSNGGQTWTAPQALQPFYTSSTNKMYVLDTTHAWAIGKNGQLYTTTGNSNWQEWQVLSGNASQFAIVQMSFVNASNGWAISSVNNTKTLIYTTDGGHTWNKE